MNRIHRLIWSEALNSWIAVAENTRGRGKRGRSALALLPAALVISLSAIAAPPAPPAPTQLPTGGQVVAGQAAITQNGARMDVHQSTQRGVVNWNTFNVGSQAQVNFNQPNASAVTLNRVLDSNPSQIFGRITSNGQVYLTNPNGVVFSPSSSVDVGALVATTHSISDADFMAGKNSFSRNGATGKIINEGKLKAELGGYIALLAPEVINNGVVIAQLGTVALAAGESITLNFDSNKTLVGITVTPSQINALVENRQAVLAPGGLIILSARAANSLHSGVIKNSGKLEANGLSMRAGKIVLEASTLVENSGVISASAGAGVVTADGASLPGGPAGRITIDAPTISNSGVIAAAGASIAAAAISERGGAITLVANNIVQTASGRMDASSGTTSVTGAIALKASQDIDLAGLVTVRASSEELAGAPAVADTQNEANITLKAGRNITLRDTAVDASGGDGAGRIEIEGGRNQPGLPPDHQPLILFLGNTIVSASSRRRGGGSGGSVTVTGNNIVLADNTQMEASGATGGGTILIGGDAHGANPVIHNAQTVFVDSNVSIRADATEHGNGGKVVLWSDIATGFKGHISAQGGALSGDGGWVEVSGKLRLEYAGLVSTTAAYGKIGTLLLDPTDITISVLADTGTMTWTGGTFTYDDATTTPSNLNTTTLQTQLGLTNVIVDTASGLGGSGDITVVDLVTWATANSLTLQANNNIIINAALTGTGPIALNAPAGAVTINAAVSAGPSVGIVTPALTLTAPGSISTAPGGSITINTDSLNLNAASALTASGGMLGIATLTPGATIGIAGGAGVLTLSAANFASNFTAGFADIAVGNPGSGDITVGGATASSDNLTLMSGGAIAINAALSVPNTLTLASAVGVSGAGDITAPNLLLNGGGPGVNFMLNTAAANNVGTLAATGVAGLSFNNSGALIIGSVNAVNGISATGAVNINTAAGDLTVAQGVASLASSLNFQAANNLDINAALMGFGPVGLNGAASVNINAAVSGGPTVGVMTPAMTMGATGSISTAPGGNIAINTDSMTLNIASTLQSAGGMLNIVSLTPATTIGIAGGAGVLALTAANFSTNFVSGFNGINVGDASSGAITVGGAITSSDNLMLNTGGAVAIDAALSGPNIALITPALTLSAPGSISAGPGGTIAINTDSLSLNAASTLQSAGGMLNIAPVTPGTTIGIAGGAGVLALSAANFSTNFVSGFNSITVGNPSAGAIDVGGPTISSDSLTLASGGVIAINAALSTGATTLVLTSGSGVSGAGDITAANLLLSGLGPGVNFMLNTAAANNVGNLAANGVGALSFLNSVGLTIGSVNAVPGITAPLPGSPISIETTTGNLIVSQNISTGDTTSAAVFLNAGKAAVAGAAGGGDIVMGAGVSTGAGGGVKLMTGSVAGSAGVSAMAGVGNSRYNSDEIGTNFSTPIGPSGTFAIYREQPTVTITATAAVQAYNGLAYAGGNGVAYGGFVNGDTSASLGGALGYAGTAQGAINVGGYVITPNGLTDGLGYALSFVNGALTINPAALTVTANSNNKLTGATQVFAGTEFTPAGLQNSETIGSVTLVSAGAAGAAVVGPYATVVSAATGGTFNPANYTISYVNGVLTVADPVVPAPVTVVPPVVVPPSSPLPAVSVVPSPSSVVTVADTTTATTDTTTTTATTDTTTTTAATDTTTTATTDTTTTAATDTTTTAATDTTTTTATTDATTAATDTTTTATTDTTTTAATDTTTTAATDTTTTAVTTPTDTTVASTPPDTVVVNTPETVQPAVNVVTEPVPTTETTVVTKTATVATKTATSTTPATTEVVATTVEATPSVTPTITQTITPTAPVISAKVQNFLPGSQVQAAIAAGVNPEQAERAGNAYSASVIKQLSQGVPLDQAITRAEQVFNAVAVTAVTSTPQGVAIQNLAASSGNVMNQVTPIDALATSRVQTAIASGVDPVQAERAGNVYSAAVVRQLSKGMPMNEAIARAEQVFNVVASMPPSTPQGVALNNLAAGGNTAVSQLSAIAGTQTPAGSAAFNNVVTASLAKGMNMAQAVQNAQVAVQKVELMAKADNSVQSALAKGADGSGALANRSTGFDKNMGGLMAKGYTMEQSIQRAAQIAEREVAAVRADASNPSVSLASGKLSALPASSDTGSTDKGMAAALARGVPIAEALKRAQQIEVAEQRAIEADSRNPTAVFSSGRSAPAAGNADFDRALSNAIARGETPAVALASAQRAMAKIPAAKPTTMTALASGENVDTLLLEQGSSRTYKTVLGNALARGKTLEQAMAMAKSAEAKNAFHFKLPNSVPQKNATGDGNLSINFNITAANGKPLPKWLKFSPESREFIANEVPDGALPMQVEMRIGNKKYVVDISEGAVLR